MDDERRDGPGWHGECAGVAPVVAWGRVDGYPWLFRARWDWWTMVIGSDPAVAPNDLPVLFEDPPGCWLAEGKYGSGAAASSMPDEVVWELVERTIEAFRAGTLPYTAPSAPL